MKKLFFLSFSIIMYTLFSCNKNHETSKKSIHSLVSDTTAIIVSEDENNGNAVDYDKTKVLKTLYVIDRKGTEIKDKANENSKTLGTYEYGTKLDIIEEGEKWYGVLDRISRKYNENGNQIESTQWEKIYVLKSKTGSVDEIALISSDLNIISSLIINQKTENFEIDHQLKDYLKLELIEKSFFDSRKNSSVNFLLADTTVTKKKKVLSN